MTIFSWFTFDKKDEYGRYIGSILYGKEYGFRKCYEHYKPNLKGGHTHNHLKNKLLKHRYLCESKRHKNERYLEDFISRRRYIPAVIHDILNRSSKWRKEDGENEK